MLALHHHNWLFVLILSLLLLEGFGLHRKGQASSKKREDEKEDKAVVSDEEYEAWLEEQLDQQLALLESMFDVSEALSIADAPLDHLDDDFLDELFKNGLKSGAEDPKDSAPSSTVAAENTQLPQTQDKVTEKRKSGDLKHLIELAVNVLGSILTEAEQKKPADKNLAKKHIQSCRNEESERAKCSGEFQRWIVYKNGDFCKPTSDGGCQGAWYDSQEPVDCLEICLYAPSAQEKKLSIRLAANSPNSVYNKDRNESMFWS